VRFELVRFVVGEVSNDRILFYALYFILLFVEMEEKSCEIMDGLEKY